jgi:tetratricopeptide (TPR) repeat protein
MNKEEIDHALELRRAGQTEQALEAFRALAQTADDPDDKAGAILQEASCLSTLRRYEEAKAGLDRARQATQKEWLHAYADEQEALVCMGEGRYEESLAIYDRVLAKYPFVATDPKYRGLYETVQAQRGILLSTLRRAEEALPILAEALKFDLSEQEHGMVIYNLGQCFLTLNDREQAKTAFEEVAKVCQDRYCVLGSRFNLGVIHAQEGAWAKAIQELHWCEEKEGAQDLPPGVLYGWLAKAHGAIGETAEAERYRKMMYPPKPE